MAGEQAETRPEEEVMRETVRKELEAIFFDLLTSAQKLSYELATLEVKDSYTREELRDFLATSRDVVANVKRMHKFLEKHAGRR